MTIQITKTEGAVIRMLRRAELNGDATVTLLAEEVALILNLIYREADRKENPCLT